MGASTTLSVLTGSRRTGCWAAGVPACASGEGPLAPPTLRPSRAAGDAERPRRAPPTGAGDTERPRRDAGGAPLGGAGDTQGVAAVRADRFFDGLDWRALERRAQRVGTLSGAAWAANPVASAITETE